MLYSCQNGRFKFPVVKIPYKFAIMPASSCYRYIPEDKTRTHKLKYTNTNDRYNIESL